MNWVCGAIASMYCIILFGHTAFALDSLRKLQALPSASIQFQEPEEKLLIVRPVKVSKTIGVNELDQIFANMSKAIDKPLSHRDPLVQNFLLVRGATDSTVPRQGYHCKDLENVMDSMSYSLRWENSIVSDTKVCPSCQHLKESEITNRINEGSKGKVNLDLRCNVQLPLGYQDKGSNQIQVKMNNSPIQISNLQDIYDFEVDFSGALDDLDGLSVSEFVRTYYAVWWRNREKIESRHSENFFTVDLECYMVASTEKDADKFARVFPGKKAVTAKKLYSDNAFFQRHEYLGHMPANYSKERAASLAASTAVEKRLIFSDPLFSSDDHLVSLRQFKIDFNGQLLTDYGYVVDTSLAAQKVKYRDSTDLLDLRGQVLAALKSVFDELKDLEAQKIGAVKNSNNRAASAGDLN